MRIHCCNIRSQPLISKPPLNPSRWSSLYFSTLSPSWNTIHIFALSNPLLSLLEKSKYFSQLKQIQSQMILTGLILDGFASSRLIAFCAISESRNLDYCFKLLFSIQNPNAFSWNVAIRGCVASENHMKALVLYKKMLTGGQTRPDNYTYPLLFKACSSLGLELNCVSYEFLGHVLKLGFDKDVYVVNAMIHFLVRTGELGLACKVFNESCVRDLVSWNSLINGHVRNGKAREALGIYDKMVKEQVKPDEVTMIGVLSSCAQLENLKLGREFHRHIGDSGLNLKISLANALMDMYVKCGDLEAATAIFDSMTKKTVVSWTTMVAGYAKHGLLDMARKFFHNIPEKNVVTWNAIIGGYVHAKRGKEALVLFQEMQSTNIQSDEVTLIHCLSACSQLGALDAGIWVHCYIQKHNIPLNVGLGTALVDMYSKCGNISNALQVFHEMGRRNSMTWTAIIGGLAHHGNAHDAVSYFSRMVNIGLIPDEITFLGVLSACCHGGLVEQGLKYFSEMKSKFNLSPQLKHYSCMVDLYGLAGLLKEAEELIESMPIEADTMVWGALFFACRIHENLLIGEIAASKLLQLDPSDCGTYVLLARTYREANMLDEAREVWKIMKERGVEKSPGSSSIEVNGIVYEFTVRDRLHPQAEQIYECVTQLTGQSDIFWDINPVLNNTDELLLGFQVKTQVIVPALDAY